MSGKKIHPDGVLYLCEKPSLLSVCAISPKYGMVNKMFCRFIDEIMEMVTIMPSH